MKLILSGGAAEEADSRSKLLQCAALIGAVRIVLAPLVLFGAAYAYKTWVLFLGKVGEEIWRTVWKNQGKSWENMGKHMEVGRLASFTTIIFWSKRVKRDCQLGIPCAQILGPENLDWAMQKQQLDGRMMMVE